MVAVDKVSEYLERTVDLGEKDEFFKMIKNYNERSELKRLYKELTQRELTCKPDWFIKWEED